MICSTPERIQCIFCSWSQSLQFCKQMWYFLILGGGGWGLTMQAHPCTHWAIKATIHQLTTMQSTSKNVLFPGHNHRLTTGVDDTTLIIARAPARVIIKVSGHQLYFIITHQLLHINIIIIITTLRNHGYMVYTRDIPSFLY